MLLHELSQKGSSLGVKLHPLKQEMGSGSYLLRDQGAKTPSLGPRTVVRLMAASLAQPSTSTPVLSQESSVTWPEE
jgi:hypothetical protein